MAFNLKDIPLPGRKGKSKSGAVQYPTKRHIDLYVGDKNELDTRKAMPFIILGALVLIAAVKFGVIDMFGKVGDAEAELASHQSLLDTAKASLKDYDKVLAEYEGYEFVGSEDGLVVDANEVLALIDKQVAPTAQVGSFSMSGDTLTMNLTGMSLDEVGQLSDKLSDQDIVSDVSVQTASTRQEAGLLATLTITLEPMAETEEADTGKTDNGKADKGKADKGKADTGKES